VREWDAGPVRDARDVEFEAVVNWGRHESDCQGRLANVYLTGTTTSTNFPVTNDALLLGGGTSFLLEMNLNVEGAGR